MNYKVFLWFATFSCNNFDHVLICSSHLMEQSYNHIELTKFNELTQMLQKL